MVGTECIETMSEQIQNAQIATQSMVGTSMGVAAAVSLINMSSPVGIWSIIHQFQMLMLLILTGAFIPIIVRNYLTGMDFALNIFELIPIYKVPFISDLYSWLKFGQQNSDLEDIGVEDESTTANNLSFLIMLLLFIIIHFLVSIFYARNKSKTSF